MKRFLKTALVISVIVTIISFSWTLFAQTTNVNVYEKLEPFFESLYFIEKDYYERDTIDYDNLVDASVRGMISGLKDPFTYYLTADDVAENQIDQEGKYGGVGLEVTYQAQMKVLQVVAPMYGTPAFKVGVKAGDLILAIDSDSVEEMTYMEAVNRLRGEPGTLVTIQVYREGTGSLEYIINREEIHTAMVQYSNIDYSSKKVGYVRINSFFKNTATELHSALQKIFDKQPQALILDLRDNPGGYLTQAILVCSMFVNTNDVIVTTRSSDGFINTYKSIGNTYPDVPMVVLVNGGSASSSEILAGALKDYNLATLVGEKTFGKAAVQTLFPLSNGGELWLTTAHYFTPKGNDIHLKGIEPDILVEPSKAQLEAVKESDSTKYEITIDTDKDIQLKTALDLLIEQL
jgi:carboxyl-terminal processing protease